MTFINIILGHYRYKHNVHLSYPTMTIYYNIYYIILYLICKMNKNVINIFLFNTSSPTYLTLY